MKKQSYDFAPGTDLRLAYAMAWVCDRWARGEPLPSAKVMCDTMERETGTAPSKSTMCRWRRIVHFVRGVPEAATRGP